MVFDPKRKVQSEEFIARISRLDWAKANDLPQIIRLQNRIYHSYSEFLARAFYAQELSYFIQAGQILVYRVLPEIHSYVIYENFEDRLEIYFLATDPCHQGNGYMQTCLKLLFYEFEKKVLLEVHRMNLRAQKMYRKLGFQQVATRKSYYPNNGDALVYQREAFDTVFTLYKDLEVFEK